MVVRVVGGAVSRDLAPDAGRAPPFGGCGVLQQQHRPALTQDVTPGGGVEGLVALLRLPGCAEPATRGLAGERVRGDPRLGPADQHRRGAATDGAASPADAVQATGALGHDHSGRSLGAVSDRHLSSAGGVEPGDRLVRAHGPSAAAPQGLDLPLAELVAARSGGEEDRGGVRVVVGRVVAGVVQRHLRGRQGHPAPAVRLHQQSLVDELGRDEAPDLARERRGVAGRVEAVDRPDLQLAPQQRAPVLLGADAAGGDHSESSDDQLPGGHRGPPSAGARRPAAAVRPVPPGPPGRVSTIADWNPPKPLPTERAAFTRCSLAVLGT